MLYIPLTLFMILIGMGFYAMVYVIPVFRLFFFDWIALIILIVPTIMLIYVIYRNKLIWNLEELQKDKLLIWFLRRDGSIVPVLGTRAYPGESFIDVPKLGLIHDLGKGSVYRIGKNPVRFALENVNHTPNPSYANFTNWLYDLGFNNLDEVQSTINDEEGYGDKKAEVTEKIEDMKPVVDKLEAEILAEEKEKQFHIVEPVKKTIQIKRRTKEEDEHGKIADILDRIKPKAFK